MNKTESLTSYQESQESIAKSLLNLTICFSEFVKAVAKLKEKGIVK